MMLQMVAGLRAGHPCNVMMPTIVSAFTALPRSLQGACSNAKNYYTTHSGHTFPPVAGQPTPSSHPHMISPHELTPGIPADEYRERRQRLAQMLPPGAVAILPAAATTYMSGVIPWPYRQDPDFFYLTGLLQHGLALITAPRGGSSQGCHFTLFIDPPNPNRERWDGASVTKEAAKEVFGADEVLMTHEMPRRLQALAHAAAATPSSSSSSSSSLAHARIWYDLDRIHGHHHSTISSALRPALEAPGRVAPLRPLLHAMRLVKSPAEAALMESSAALASAALRHCMSVTGPGTTEYGLAATFEYTVKAAGAQRLSYPSVVAGGSDACTIHYSRNDKTLEGGQLVLMDAGAEYWGYVSDVTRTWPVGGTFSGPQRDVYAVVLEAHQRCLAACRPGSSIRELHSLCIDILSEGLRQLRILPGAGLQEIKSSLYRDFFWHSLGHYLGLDTHDTHLVGHDRKLAPGAVITVEPGLYIPDDPRYGPFRGIGVRIEDDVLLTAAGCRVLSDKAPVSIAEVEEVSGSAVQAAAAGGRPAGSLPIPPRVFLPPAALRNHSSYDGAKSSEGIRAAAGAAAAGAATVSAARGGGAAPAATARAAKAEAAVP